MCMKRILCLMLFAFSMLVMASAFADNERSKDGADRTELVASFSQEQDVIMYVGQFASSPETAVAAIWTEETLTASLLINETKTELRTDVTYNYLQLNNPTLHLDPGLLNA